MKKLLAEKKWWVVLAAAAAVFAAALTLFIFVNKEESYRSIKIVEMKGGVTIDRQAAGIMNAAVNMNLESGDRVRTEEGAYVVLRLDSDKYVMLGEQGAMTVKANGDEKNGKASIELESGSVLSEIQNPLNENSSYEIATPHATMSVRGTVFEVRREQEESDEDVISVIVYEGSVAVGMGGAEPVLCGAGECMQFTDNENPKILQEKSAIPQDMINEQMQGRLEQIEQGGRKLNAGDAKLNADAPMTSTEPTVTAEPKATEEPKVTVEPKATAEPKATVEPKATTAPAVSARPAETAAPASQAVRGDGNGQREENQTSLGTAESEQNGNGNEEASDEDDEDEEAPASSVKPVETQTPVPTQQPVETQTPVPTQQPVETQTPVPSQQPVETQTPAPSADPVETQTPAPSADPVETQTPAPSADPVETQTPAPSADPVETQTPAPSADPVETQTPAPSQQPDWKGDRDPKTYQYWHDADSKPGAGMGGECGEEQTSQVIIAFYLPEIAESVEKDGVLYAKLPDTAPLEHCEYITVSADGTKITEPQLPEGYEDSVKLKFVGWYTEYDEPWDFEKDKVYSNLYLFPVWEDAEAKYYPVIYRAKDESYFRCACVKKGSALYERPTLDGSGYQGYSQPTKGGSMLAAWEKPMQDNALWGIATETVDGFESLRAVWLNESMGGQCLAIFTTGNGASGSEEEQGNYGDIVDIYYVPQGTGIPKPQRTLSDGVTLPKEETGVKDWQDEKGQTYENTVSEGGRICIFHAVWGTVEN